jgi:hypothetical protein
MTTARWPARVALVAALAAPLLAATAPADAAPLPICRTGQAQYAPPAGRAWVPERPAPRVRVCKRLRPLVWKATR